MHARRILANIVCLVALAAVPMLGGCNIFGWAMSAVPEHVKAQHVPPTTPMLVLVENRVNPGSMVAESDELTGFIMDELATYKVAPLIELKKLYELRDREAGIDKMTITQIGKAVGAQQVLYVDLQRLNVGETEPGIPAHGRVDATVHLVDVKTGKTMFPTMGQADWPINLETAISDSIQRTNAGALREAMLRKAGTAIGQLFHDYTVM